MGFEQIEPPTTLLFHHITNTGGVTFLNVMMDSGLKGYNAINQVPQSIDEFHNICTAIKEVENIGEEKIFIHGHWLNGIPSVISSEDKYFTILRDPLSRFLSEFFWSRRNDQRTEFTPWTLMDELSEWVSRFEEIGHANHYCYEIVTPITEKPTFQVHLNPVNLENTSDSELYSKANSIIKKKFYFVGITELFEESLFWLYRMFGWQEIAMWVRAVYAPGRGASPYKITPEVIPLKLKSGQV